MTWTSLIKFCACNGLVEEGGTPTIPSRDVPQRELNSRTQYGSSAMHFVALGNNIHLALWLVEHGAKIEVTNSDGETPLHWACQHGHIQMVEFFILRMNLKYIKKKDYSGLRAVDWAKECKFRDVLLLFKSIGLTPSRKRIRRWKDICQKEMEREE